MYGNNKPESFKIYEENEKLLEHLMEVLKKRNEFKLASSGKKFVTPSFIFLEHNLEDKMHSSPKIGYTASKKIGTSVHRLSLIHI